MLIVDYNTYSAPRFQLSYALSQIRSQQGSFVVNAFHRNVRKIWRTVLPPQ